MAFWFWVVVLSILGLGLYELYSRYKQKNNPPLEESAGEEESLEKLQAELARARMKIAALESRLEETRERLEASESQREAETTALFVQEERYREQLEKTERAYQRQMVTLSERLSANGNGSTLSQHEPIVEYPVRLAAEVAAWRDSLGGGPLVETAVSDDAASLAHEIIENIDAPDPAEEADLEETADPIIDRSPVGAEPPVNVAPPVSITPPEPELLEAVVLSDAVPAPEEDILNQVIVFDEVTANPVAEEDPATKDVYFDQEVSAGDEALNKLNASSEFEASSELETSAATDVSGSEEAFFELDVSILDGVSVEGDARNTNEEPAEDRALNMSEVPGIDQNPATGHLADAVEEEPQEPVKRAESSLEEGRAGVEEVPPLENHWADDLMSIAMQRIMARQLGSEMDADYLDDEEFMREMGMEKEIVAQEAQAKQENWITDPLKEMANFLNGVEPRVKGEGHASAPAGNYPERQTEEITGKMWEDVIFSSREAVAKGDGDEPESDLTPQTAHKEQKTAVDDKAFDTQTEQEAIAAAVASILSRAPEPIDAPIDEKPVLPEEVTAEEETAVSADADIPEAVDKAENEEQAQDPAELQDEQEQSPAEPAEPVFVWSREPISWHAEYFDNTTLSDEPALVRQDEDIDFEWMGDSPAKGLDPRYFSVRWSGNLSLEPGQYRFMASAPDGLRLWLNDRLVISAWYDQSEQTYQRDFAWPGGTIDVRVEHYENGGSAKAFMTWERVA